MKISDAMKILSIDEAITHDELKIAYKRACSKYHPDKGGSTAMMQSVNAAYESLKNADLSSIDAINYSNSSTYPEELNAAINAIIELSEVTIEVCGAWIWLYGNTKEHKEVIKQAGFKWAVKKKMWYFRPDDWKGGRGNFSIDDIRSKYGSSEVKAREKQKLTAA